MNMCGASNVDKYFSENSAAWIADAYHDDGYNYPVGSARLARVRQVMRAHLPNGANLVDLGCGGGQVALALAADGFNVIGVDKSNAMIATANQTLNSATPAIRSRVRFVADSLEATPIESETIDAVVSLGVIGYLAADEVLLLEASRILKPDGLLVISCRNRLFNMVSVTDYTLREISNGAAEGLVREIMDLMQMVPPEAAADFVRAMALASAECSPQEPVSAASAPPPLYTHSIEARQHTPRQLEDEAARHGFEKQALFGVHPHLLMAGVNRLLPRGLYNRLSSSLDAFSHLPVSLIWSSVFIGVFRKG